MDTDTLVVGPVLEGHTFEPGTHDICGRNIPWNTCAIWSLDKLALIGFPLIGDGYHTSVPGGVEEVSAIAMAQMLNRQWEAKLIQMSNDTEGSQVKWNTTFADESRRLYHEKKMASKNSRPAAQMSMLGEAVGTGRVRHIKHENLSTGEVV